MPYPQIYYWEVINNKLKSALKGAKRRSVMLLENLSVYSDYLAKSVVFWNVLNNAGIQSKIIFRCLEVQFVVVTLLIVFSAIFFNES